MAFGSSQYLSQLRNISMFDEDTYKKATADVSGPFKIIIKPIAPRIAAEGGKEDVGVKGIIQAPISFNMQANWDTLGLENIFSSLISQNSILKAVAGAAQTVMGASGSSISNSGLVTRKVYTKSDYLTFEVKFRVLDWDDDGMPVKTAQVMMALCAPRKTLSTTVGSVLNLLPDESPIKVAGTKVQEGIQTASNSSNEVVANFAGSLKTGIDMINEGKINVTQAPSPVSVEIGHWFKADDCVITTVGMEFSEGMTVAGPMYADFSVSISTREAITIGAEGVDGLRIGAPNVGRVKFATAGTLQTF